MSRVECLWAACDAQIFFGCALGEPHGFDARFGAHVRICSDWPRGRLPCTRSDESVPVCAGFVLRETSDQVAEPQRGGRFPAHGVSRGLRALPDESPVRGGTSVRLRAVIEAFVRAIRSAHMLREASGVQTGFDDAIPRLRRGRLRGAPQFDPYRVEVRENVPDRGLRPLGGLTPGYFIAGFQPAVGRQKSTPTLRSWRCLLGLSDAAITWRAGDAVNTHWVACGRRLGCARRFRCTSGPAHATNGSTVQ